MHIFYSKNIQINWVSNIIDSIVWLISDFPAIRALCIKVLS